MPEPVLLNMKFHPALSLLELGKEATTLAYSNLTSTVILLEHTD